MNTTDYRLNIVTRNGRRTVQLSRIAEWLSLVIPVNQYHQEDLGHGARKKEA